MPTFAFMLRKLADALLLGLLFLLTGVLYIYQRIMNPGHRRVETCNRCGRMRKDWKHCKRCGNRGPAELRKSNSYQLLF